MALNHLLSAKNIFVPRVLAVLFFMIVLLLKMAEESLAMFIKIFQTLFKKILKKILICILLENVLLSILLVPLNVLWVLLIFFAEVLKLLELKQLLFVLPMILNDCQIFPKLKKLSKKWRNSSFVSVYFLLIFSNLTKKS